MISFFLGGGRLKLLQLKISREDTIVSDNLAAPGQVFDLLFEKETLRPLHLFMA